MRADPPGSRLFLSSRLVHCFLHRRQKIFHHCAIPQIDFRRHLHPGGEREAFSVVFKIGGFHRDDSPKPRGWHDMASGVLAVALARIR